MYWVNAHCQTYDPRLLPADPVVPFHLYPRQEEFLLWLKEREEADEDGLAEKSRDVGFTWLCAADALHGWLFRPGFSAGFGSRKEELVDRIGNPDTIFGKIRILLENLPEWMQPAGFKASEHDNYMRLIHPSNGATITGEAGDNIGRGGRKTKYYIDEAAFLAHPLNVEKALSQTTRCRIWVSTPNGDGNPFATKRNSGKISVFTFHWKDDPRKNAYNVRDEAGAIVSTGRGQAPPPPPGGRVEYPWYEAEKIRLNDPVTVAQELDIDYTASVAGVCIPAVWVRAAVELELPLLGPMGAGLDVADEEGAAENVLAWGRGPVIEGIKAWNGINTTQTAWRAADESEALGVTELRYDCIGVGAGVRGTYDSAVERKLTFTPIAVNVGESPTEAVWPDGKTSKERFLNLRAEAWWTLRRRFEKAWEYRELGTPHPPEEMISIPNDRELIAQLSRPKAEPTENGKIQIESKKKMALRGVKSPDRAEAVLLRFIPVEPDENPLGGLLVQGSAQGWSPRL